MGLAEGGITYCTYYIRGELPPDCRQHFLERVKLYRFEPLLVESEEDISYGWVPLRNILSREFQTTDLFDYNYLILALRIDRWALPPALLKGRLRLAVEAKLQELSRDHLSRIERGELVERERLRLKKQTLPAVRVFDLAWNLDTHRLRFGSLSRTVNEQFVDLFEKTFDLQLVADSPYISAIQGGLNDELIAGLADVEPARLLGEPF